MRLQRFHLERYFEPYEFTARHLLSSSDCESYGLAELLEWADDECHELWQGLRLGYTESRGLPALRREIAGLYEGVKPDDILEVVPEEGILLAMTVLLEPGDHVIATHPGYQTLYGIAEMLGCEVTYWQPDEEQGWRFDPAFVRAHLRPTTRLIVANFPHNPTGALLTGAEFEEVLGLAAAAGAHLFSDEMYRWLERDPAGRLPSAVEKYEKAVTLCGLSKSFSLPGLRVGWLATRDRELAARVAAAKDYTTICGGAPGEVLGLIGLRERRRIVARNRERIAANLERLCGFVAARPELLSLVPPQAGSVCFPRLHAAEGASAFCRRLVDEAGVLLVPSSAFACGDAHVRFGLGRAGFAEGLAAFAEWLDGR
ncbi:MAG: aminotransferase class I/II-fold pyridoxal phosphate-dependent enzyme [Thermoleophilia bacterium]